MKEYEADAICERQKQKISRFANDNGLNAANFERFRSTMATEDEHGKKWNFDTKVRQGQGEREDGQSAYKWCRKKWWMECESVGKEGEEKEDDEEKEWRRRRKRKKNITKNGKSKGKGKENETRMKRFEKWCNQSALDKTQRNKSAHQKWSREPIKSKTTWTHGANVRRRWQITNAATIKNEWPQSGKEQEEKEEEEEEEDEQLWKWNVHWKMWNKTRYENVGWVKA